MNPGGNQRILRYGQGLWWSVVKWPGRVVAVEEEQLENAESPMKPGLFHVMASLCTTVCTTGVIALFN
jgi:hypothetical protein